MTEGLRLLFSFLAGTALGTFYFTGLWLTVRNLPDTGRPAARVFWSFIARSAVAAAGFAAVMNGRWEQPAAALIGFLAVREILVRRLGRQTA